MAILGIDIGSSFVKAALLGKSPIARVPCEIELPSADRAELDLRKVWSAILAAAKQCLRSYSGERIDGIGLSCLTPALVLLGENDKPLGPAYTHLDRRSREQASRIWKEVGPEFHASTGNLPLPGGMSAVTYKALAASGVKRYLHLNGWVGAKLTGVFAFDPANAAFTGLYSLFPGEGWSERWCRYFGVDPKWLAPVVSGDAVLGALTKEAAAELGLKPGIPVKLGTADTSSALLAVGAGNLDLLHVAGTTQVLAAIVDKPEPHPRRLVRPLGVGKRFVHVTHNPVGGAALEWLRGLCFAEMPSERYYGGLLEAALGRKTEVELDPCYLGGDRLEMERRSASFNHLSLSVTREDLLAAVLKAMKRGHEQALTDLGVGPRKTHLTGGAASILKRLLPEYRDLEPVEEGSLLGISRLFP
jgi:xylulokinase